MIIGITAEWNPFHLGHAYMVEHLKREYPDARLLAVMSGPFVQRGELHFLISGHALPGLYRPESMPYSNCRAPLPFRARIVLPNRQCSTFIPCTARILPLAQNPQRSRNCRKRPDGLPVMNTCQYFTPF